jgi:hypothetical protein
MLGAGSGDWRDGTSLKVEKTDPTSCTVELSMEELGLLMNALWQELGYQAQRTSPLSDDVKEGYDALQKQLLDVIARMDELPRRPPD